MKRLSSVLITLGTAFVVACGGGDDGTGPGDDNDNGGPGGGATRQILANPSFANDIIEIFTRRGCATGACHGTSGASNLDLRASAAYGDLVGVTSFGDGNEVRVIAGDAQNSYLVKKLEGRQTVGARMPLNGAPLDNIDLTNVRNWIDQGAQNN
jgi:hypothetical protein